MYLFIIISSSTPFNISNWVNFLCSVHEMQCWEWQRGGAVASWWQQVLPVQVNLGGADTDELLTDSTDKCFPRSVSESKSHPVPRVIETVHTSVWWMWYMRIWVQVSTCHWQYRCSPCWYDKWNAWRTYTGCWCASVDRSIILRTRNVVEVWVKTCKSVFISITWNEKKWKEKKIWYFHCTNIKESCTAMRKMVRSTCSPQSISSGKAL